MLTTCNCTPMMADVFCGTVAHPSEYRLGTDFGAWLRAAASWPAILSHGDDGPIRLIGPSAVGADMAHEVEVGDRIIHVNCDGTRWAHES